MQAIITMHQEALPVVRSSLDLKRKALEFNLRQYRARLTRFEAQYSMSSEEFEAKFQAGALEDDADWFEWEFVLDGFRQTAQQIDLLKSVRL